MDLFEYWEQSPPSHELLGVVATWLGWERKTKPSAPRQERDNVLPFDNSKHTKERQDVAILQLAAFAKSGGGVIQRRKKQS